MRTLSSPDMLCISFTCIHTAVTSPESGSCHAAGRMHAAAYCKHTQHQCMKPGRPLIFLLQWCTIWPQSTSFTVTEGSFGVFVIPTPSPHYPKLLTSAVWAAWLYDNGHAAFMHGDRKSDDTRESSKKTHSSVSSLEFFFFSLILFSSHQKISSGWQVVSS